MALKKQRDFKGEKVLRSITARAEGVIRLSKSQGYAETTREQKKDARSFHPLTPRRLCRGCVTYATGRGRASDETQTTSASGRGRPARAFRRGNKRIWVGLPSGQVPGAGRLHHTTDGASRVEGKVMGQRLYTFLEQVFTYDLYRITSRG